MENKHLILILVAVIAVVAVAAVVMFNGNGDQDVGGVKFNIPEKYAEDTNYTKNETDVKLADNFTVNASCKVFRNGSDAVRIFVYETASPAVAKEVYDNSTANPVPGAMEKTVNGKKVIALTQNNIESYSYVQDQYMIVVESPNETLLDSIVK